MPPFKGIPGKSLKVMSAGGTLSPLSTYYAFYKKLQKESLQGLLFWFNLKPLYSLASLWLSYSTPSFNQGPITFPLKQGILRRLVKLPHGKLSYYACKLLKSQLPSLGRKFVNGNNLLTSSFILLSKKEKNSNQLGNMRMVTSIMYELRSRYSDASLLTPPGEDDEDEERFVFF